KAVYISVPAIWRRLAPRRAARGHAVGRQVDPVITLFGRVLDDVVTTSGRQCAVLFAGPVGAGVVGSAEVTRLSGGDDAVPTYAVADAGRGVEPAERQLVVGAGHVTLGLKDGDLIDVAGHHPKAARHCGAVRRRRSVAHRLTRARRRGVVHAELGAGAVEGDDAPQFIVDAAEIDGKLAVDEHPHVVVAAELELFAPVVLEPVVGLAGEAVVVDLGGVGGRIVDVAEAQAVQWKERRAVVLVRAGGDLTQGQRALNRDAGDG